MQILYVAATFNNYHLHELYNNNYLETESPLECTYHNTVLLYTSMYAFVYDTANVLFYRYKILYFVGKRAVGKDMPWQQKLPEVQEQ